MIVSPHAIAPAAIEAEMKVPDDPMTYDPVEYPHWHVYCCVQLGVPVQWGNHWENAKIIAKIPDDKILTVTMADLVALGFSA